MSKLKNGRVPKGTHCPFDGECGIDTCPVWRKTHAREVDFSCALARGLDLCNELDEHERECKDRESAEIAHAKKNRPRSLQEK